MVGWLVGVVCVCVRKAEMMSAFRGSKHLWALPEKQLWILSTGVQGKTNSNPAVNEEHGEHSLSACPNQLLTADPKMN